MLLIKRFAGDLVKLKGFLAQIKFKIYQEGIRLKTAADKVAFAEMFLIGDLLRQFKPYFAELQRNGETTTNVEVKYMFLSWEGFKEKITQIYGDPKEEATAKRKLQALIQKGSVIDYTTTF